MRAMSDSSPDPGSLETQYEGMLRIFTIFPVFWGLLYGVYHRSILAIVAGVAFAGAWWAWVHVLVHGLPGRNPDDVIDPDE